MSQHRKCVVQKSSIPEERPYMSKIFPEMSETHKKLVTFPKKNTRIYGQGLASKEIFELNWASTESYRKSTIPFCKRFLNDDFNFK